MNSEDQKDNPQDVSGDEPDITNTGSDDMADRLAEAEREKEQYMRLAQRAQADLVNSRNRVHSDQETLQARTVQRVATRFIEVADQLEKALEPETAAGVDKQWVSGVEAIYHYLLNVLKTEGFERFDADGEEFDPRRHDALLASPTADHPPNSVMRQLAAGYMRNGEVVRPAQVEIAAAHIQQGSAEDSDKNGDSEITD
jgi:molecular chaperone GrpE